MTDLHSALERALPDAIEDLRRLVAIPSISAMPEHQGDIHAAADEVQRVLREIGCPEVRLLDGGGKPAVYGHFPAPAGQPTVLLYAHYDVQPTGDLAGWTNPPFEATERDGRMYGRGTADDKGGVATHFAVLRAFDGKPPVGVKVFIEGEEEIGSPSMGDTLDKYADELSADVFVICDASNWDVGVPGITTRLRGLVDAKVTVSTLRAPLHSGMHGGIVSDALTAFCRLVATLHDEQGNVAIEGLLSSDDVSVDYTEEQLRSETGMLDGVEFIGEGPLAARLWAKPAASVLAIDTTRVKDVSNSLIPSVTGIISVRIAPNDDPDRAAAAVERHLLKNAPWGAKVEVEMGRGGAGGVVDLNDPRAQLAIDAIEEAFGVAPVEIGVGGSIPIVSDFQKRNPGALVLVTAVTDPYSNIHGYDESLGLDDFRSTALAEALLLDKLSKGQA